MSKLSQLNGVDVAKFVMALAVVAIHVQPAYYDGQVYPDGFVWFIRLAVPFFFIGSGYLVGRRMESVEDDGSRRDYLRSKARNFFRLFLLWALIYLPFTLFELYKGGVSGLGQGLMKAVGLFTLCGDEKWGWAIWYLYASGVAYWLLSLIRRPLCCLPALFVFFVAVLFVNHLVEGLDGSSSLVFVLQGVTGRVLGGGVFIVAGMLLYRWRRVLVRPLVGAMLLAISAMAFLTEARFLNVVPGGAGLFVLVACIKLADSAVYLRLRMLSMWVYYLHMIVIAVFYMGLKVLGDIPGVWTMLGVTATVSVVLSVIVDVASRRVACCSWLKRLVS